MHGGNRFSGNLILVKGPFLALMSRLCSTIDMCTLQYGCMVIRVCKDNYCHRRQANVFVYVDAITGVSSIQRVSRVRYAVYAMENAGRCTG